MKSVLNLRQNGTSFAVGSAWVLLWKQVLNDINIWITPLSSTSKFSKVSVASHKKTEAVSFRHVIIVQCGDDG